MIVEIFFDRLEKCTFSEKKPVPEHLELLPPLTKRFRKCFLLRAQPDDSSEDIWLLQLFSSTAYSCLLSTKSQERTGFSQRSHIRAQLLHGLTNKGNPLGNNR